MNIKQDNYCTTYKIIIIQDRRWSLYKIQDYYCTRYKKIIVRDARLLLYKILQDNNCTIYKIIIVQDTRVLLYKIQILYKIQHNYCTWYMLYEKTAQNGSIDFTTHQENQMVLAQCYDWWLFCLYMYSVVVHTFNPVHWILFYFVI